MLIDLTNTTVDLTFSGNLYRGEGNYALIITSLYNNNYILNNADTGDGIGGFELEILEYNSRFTKVRFDFTNTDLQTKDIEGFYQWVFYYESDIVEYGICKIKNASETSGASGNTEYISNNEYNEQYTFYK